MFKNPVVINSEEHSRVRFTPAQNLSFARDTSHAPVLAFELEEMAKYFPIVFDATTGSPVALFGLKKGNNAYLTEENRWQVPVLPSALSCYPFGLYRADDSQFLMIMDDSAETLQSTKGKLLYNKNGKGFRPSPLLKSLKERLEVLEKQRHITDIAFRALKEHGVLVENEARFTIAGESHKLAGFSVINWEAVSKLDDEVRALWERGGLLRMMQAQTESLKHFRILHRLHQQAS